MPIFVKQAVLDAHEAEAGKLSADLDLATQELERTKSMLHTMDQKYEALTQLQSAKDAKFVDLQKQAKVFENAMQEAYAALSTQAQEANAILVLSEKDRDAHIEKLVADAALQMKASKAVADSFQSDLNAEIAANKALRETVNDLRQTLLRVQTERDTLEADQRRVRLDCEAQLRAFEQGGLARINVLEAELSGFKKKG